MSYRVPRWALGLIGSCLLLAATAAGADPTLPDNFVVENAVPGTTFNVPVTMAFLPNGRMIVGEKRGVAWMINNGTRYATPLWSAENEVLNDGDRGLLSVAVDPDFDINRFVYFLYTVDPDSNGVDNNDDAFGRLVRYQVSAGDSNALDPNSRAVLFGRNWTEGACIGSITHSIGALRWGRDKSLLVSVGEGAQFTTMDPGGLDPNMFGPGKTDPAEDIGAFRSQYLNSLSGKILRLNPADGHGYPSNPYWDGNPMSVRSRVYAYGLRNPFRFNVKPLTGATNPASGQPGTLYVGDVGWRTWEELSVIHGPGANLGWPCHEGFNAEPEYQAASPAHNGCGTIGTPVNPGTLTYPIASWHHTNSTLSTPPGFDGNAAIGGVFYSASTYPSLYQNRFFFGDYGGGWIKLAVTDVNDQLVQILPFADEVGGPVDFAVHPLTGDVYYVAIVANTVVRIRYNGSIGGNTPPTASASAEPSMGQIPLAVNFSSAGSMDLDGDSLTYTWVFGDGNGSFQPNPSHTYVSSGVFKAILTVDDGRGAVGRDTVLVYATATSGFPTTGFLDRFNRPNGPLGNGWMDPAYGLTGVNVSSTQLLHSCCYQAPVWGNDVFGPDQEAFVTLSTLQTNAPGHDLMLKVQGNSWDDPHVEVRYDDQFSRVGVHVFDGSTWTTIGFLPAVFISGDQLGARAYANGNIELYQNGELIGSFSLLPWAWATLGGRIGLTLDGTVGARLDDFGGGNTVFAVNTAPTATILAPADGSFYAAGESVPLQGQGFDPDQSSETLNYTWVGNLHHNNHVHPSTFVTSGVNTSFAPENHDDGTGVWFEVELRVTDIGGLADTARVNLFPEINLTPSAITRRPGLPGEPTEYRFKIHNLGRMPAPTSRWRLIADQGTLAEGDVVVPALDSLLIDVEVEEALSEGWHTVRAVVDTLVAVHETDETDNASTRDVLIPEGTTDAPGGPRTLHLSSPYPNPSQGSVAMALELPTAMRVEFSVHDIQGREVWKESSRTYQPGRWVLNWSGRDPAGGRISAGVYLAQVRLDGGGSSSVVLKRRIAIVR